jgi:hypothetical protein
MKTDIFWGVMMCDHVYGRFSETLMNLCQSTRRQIPESSILHSHIHDKLKSDTFWFSLPAAIPSQLCTPERPSHCVDVKKANCKIVE